MRNIVNNHKQTQITEKIPRQLSDIKINPLIATLNPRATDHHRAIQ